MILDQVTFTGADDSVDFNELRRISDAYPFVEWGILYSRKQNGKSPRFPSEDWRSRLCNMRRPVDLSLHLCGSIVRDLCIGRFPEISLIDFKRMQLNFHAEAHAVVPRDFINTLTAIQHQYGIQIIFQLDHVNDELFQLAGRHGINCAALFDTSHGAGISPKSWPLSIDNTYCGYAGGLGPNNVLAELKRIEEVTEDDDRIWIDMERKVRSADDSQFDLEAVEAVLRQVECKVGEHAKK